jgi:dimethylhistidine N-methyltransferase
MPPSLSFQYEDLKPEPSSFLQDVIAGLSLARKAIAPKYFYDARGSELFDAICKQPEYYPTRTELAMLQAHRAQIAERAGAGSAIIEYGTGSAQKTHVLIDALQPRAYVSIDISGEQLLASIAELATAFPWVRMFAVCADYTRSLALKQLADTAVTRRIVYFPGSTIGNFDIPDALEFLVNARTVAGAGGAMLVGVDLKKSPHLLHAAYNDAKGVTAEFNLNLLHRINRELGADFDVSAFEHHAHYDEAEGRIEMHLVSRREQRVLVNGHRFAFADGEHIHTENSYKYSVDEFQTLARQAGFEAAHCWVDPQRLFSIHYLTIPPR